MTKSPGKKRKKGQRTPNIPLASTLRPRLDALWGDETLMQRDITALYTDLDSVAQGVRPQQLLPVMLTAYQAASPAAQERLTEVLPDWLRERQFVDPLEQLIAKEQLDAEQQQQALHWLEEVGSDTSELLEQASQSWFYKAFYHNDEYQATLILLWYLDRRRNRVQGINLLIDYQPPWNGSAKDITLYPKRPPEQAVEQFVGFWNKQMPVPIGEVGEHEARDVVINSLEATRRAGVRLHSDFVSVREDLLRYVFTMAGSTDAPEFDADALDFILSNGKRAEEIMYMEEMGIRMVRTDSDHDNADKDDGYYDDEDDDDGYDDDEDEEDRDDEDEKNETRKPS